jgi:2-methylcitrate dehydratase PrpD
MNEPGAARRLAGFARAVFPRSLPGAVLDRVATHTLDTLGVCAAASLQEFAPAVRSVATALGGPPEATAIGARARLPAPNAALLNGTLAHGLDYDDTHLAAIVHPSCTVVPAALAVAEEIGADGERALRSVAVGVEAAVRIGLAAHGGFHDRGFHPTPICGTFGAALAAGALYDLDEHRLVSALGLAASMASGLLEFLTDGTSAKRLHGGWAAHAGVLAARLARAGLSGPAGGIDGRFGILRSILGEAADASVVARELGERWELLDVALKPYPCCHYLHAFLDAAVEIRGALGVGPGDRMPRELAERIERVDGWIAPREVPVVCEPLATKRRPQTPYDAQFSLPFSVAVMLERGRVTLAEYTEETIRDAALGSIAARVRYHPDESADFPRRFPGRLRVTLSDGRVLDAVRSDNRGGPSAPLSPEEVAAKFRANASPLLGERGVAATIARLRGRGAGSVAALLEPFAGGTEP